MRYIFDVDGALVPSRGVVDSDQERTILRWARSRRFYLASGATYERLRSQMPETVLDRANGVFAEHCGEFWCQGERQWRREHNLSEVMPCLDLELRRSDYALRHPPHVEFRGGMINFSLPGHGSSEEERDLYAEWDAETGERERAVARLSAALPGLVVSLGGRVSVDITHPDCERARVLPHIREQLEYDGPLCLITSAYSGSDRRLTQTLLSETGVKNNVVPVSSHEQFYWLLSSARQGGSA